MLTHGEDVEIHALRKRGWSYESIGRHIGRDWRTVKAYIEGNREPGTRRRRTGYFRRTWWDQSGYHHGLVRRHLAAL